MKFRVIMITLIILSFASVGYAVDNNFGNTDLNPLLGKLVPKYLQYVGVNMGGASTIVSTVSPISAANIAFAVISINSGKTKTMGLANGESGQILKIRAGTITDSGTVTIAKYGGTTATTTTGWTTIALSADGYFVTLLWVDDTVGWIVIGQYGATVS